MRISRLAVSKYRSIDRQASFDLSNFTVLVGPNNQGKSNLLRALVLGMDVIQSWAELPGGATSKSPSIRVSSLRRRGWRPGIARGRSGEVRGYEWDTDYPVFARNRKGSQQTVIQLTFELSEVEQTEFSTTTGITTNGVLPIEIRLGKTTAAVGVRKPGKGAQTHREKSSEIARFISERISVLSVPAIRTSEQAISLIDQIVSLRQRDVLQGIDYIALQEQLATIQEESIRELERSMAARLSMYAQTVKSVSIDVTARTTRASVEGVTVDDGAETSLADKGDGVKSLLTMALMHELASLSSTDDAILLAVEEPEAHLHPSAIHEIKRVLSDVAKNQQVIVTTHSPPLVNRESIGANVLVNHRSAVSASSIDEIRESLGTKQSDNLSSADVVVFVEGTNDAEPLSLVLAARSKKVAGMLSSGNVVVEPVNGAGSVAWRVRYAKSMLAIPLVVLDGDEAGKHEASKLVEAEIVRSSDICLMVAPNLKVSEFEDLVELGTYVNALESFLKFELKPRERGALASGRNGKWSDRLKQILDNRGWPDAKGSVKVCKALVAQSVISSPTSAIREDCSEVLDRLIGRVEESMLKG